MDRTVMTVVSVLSTIEPSPVVIALIAPAVAYALYRKREVIA